MKKPIEVIAVYYPHWHVYPKGNEWFHPGWTEWEYVKDAVPRFPGHRQPLVPLGGYLDGANPADVAKEIDLAANAGIDVFLYDYYWYDGKVTQEEAIEKGFLGAPNRDRMKFAIMWCYHERDRAWRPKIGEKRERLMSLAHTKDEFLGLVRHCVANYFPRPEYWRKDGRLFFSIFNAPYFFVRRESSPERVRAELDEARQIVRAAGLGEIHFNAQGCGPQLADAMADGGFDSTTDYNLTMNNMPREETAAMREKGVWEVDYRAVFPAMRARWREMATRRLPYIPNVTTGWDATPRCRLDEPYPWRKMEYPYTMTITDNTPDAFRELLAEAKAFAENDPKKPGAVYINGWNEYTEGTYLVPSNFYADGFLRAVADVFGPHKALHIFVEKPQASTGDKPAKGMDDAAKMGAAAMNPDRGLGCVGREGDGDFKVLIYGNSIAFHAPKADVGWMCNWGMAASAPEKDFAHLVVAGLEERRGGRADFRIRNLAALERDFTADLAAVPELADDAAWGPDYVVIAIGENVRNIEAANASAYRKFLADLARPFASLTKRPVIVMRSGFWHNAAKARCTEEAASDVGAVYVDAGSLGGVDENKALGLFTHTGVANHPGDLGMRRLADLILAGFDGARG